jgi:predicted secreted protein
VQNQIKRANALSLTAIVAVLALFVLQGFSVVTPVQADSSVNNFSVEVNFQPSRSWLPAGYVGTGAYDHVPDIGLPYGARSQGFTYGWNVDNQANTRDRDVLSPDATVFSSYAQKEDTLILMQKNGNFSWEIAVPTSGLYMVELFANDPSYTDSVYNTLVEGVEANNRPGSATNWSYYGYATARVTDGRLTVTNGPSAVNNKLNWIKITRLFQVKINFQPSGTPLVSGYLPDYGDAYADRGNGFTYGWSGDNRANTRDRNSSLSPDQRYDTLALTQKNGSNFSWEIKVPQGQYTVRVVAGDPNFTDSVYKFADEEDVIVVEGTPNNSQRWFEGTTTFVQVFESDGRLTISNAPGSVNNKIAFIEIEQTGIGR